MNDGLSYLRTKDKYIIDAASWSNGSILIEVFGRFGPGVYWTQTSPSSKNQSPPNRYEAWLTPEELTTLKIMIPQITFTKVT
jgi:hypothetical protein